jgi:site-specific recombinase XerD
VPWHFLKAGKDHLERRKGQSPRSIEYALSVTRQIFNTAKRLGIYAGDNPTAKVKFPKPDNARMRFMTRKEADRLLSALKEKSPDVHDMTMLSLHAGLRFGEIASLLSENRLKDAAKALGAAWKDHTEQEAAGRVVNSGK